MTYYGFAGKELLVDLTSRDIKETALDAQEAAKFLGGMGLQLKRLYELLKPGTDPLSPENPLIIGSGPLVGTSAPGTPRVLATTKYPETGAVGSGAGAMRFGFMLKLAGYDHIVITGKASKPVYLKVIDNDVEVCDASHIWGKDIVETTETLWAEYGDCGVIAMGQAGENMAVIAQTVCDNGASLGRGGLGGIMGSKNLKALVAKGTGSIKIADPVRFGRAVEGLFERVKRYPYHEEVIRFGIMPNWANYGIQMGYTKIRTEPTNFAEVDKAVGFEAYRKLGKKAFGCPSCFIADKEIIEVPEGRFKGLKWSTPSYLNAAGLGGLLGLRDSGEAVKFGDVTDRLGLDQISFAGILDCLITLYQEGRITKEDVGGLPLNRDIDTVITWAESTAFRNGFGDIVAGGWSRVIEKLGNDLGKRLDIIKGRQGVWEPRLSGLGTNEFAQMVYPRGPNAECGGSGLYTLNQPTESVRRHAERMGMAKEQIDRAFDSPLKINIGRLTTNSEHWLALFNSLGICNRHVNNRFYHINIISELYSAATGVELSPHELMLHAERVWNLFKMINVREGFSRKDDEPPDKWFEPMRTYDGKKLYMMDYYKTKRLTREDVSQWLNDYYDEREWNIENGLPTKEKLTELDLKGLIPDLKKGRIQT